MKQHRLLTFFLIAALLIISNALYGEGDHWWNRLLPDKSPQVLTDTPHKPLIEPPQAVVSLQDSFVKVAEVTKPATVNISAVQVTKVQDDPHQFYFGDPNEFFYRFFGDEGQPPRQRREREYRTEGTGSGVIIDPDGYILTNNHVVQGADQLTVTLESGKTYKGTVVGTDPRTDLAVIKIKGSGSFSYVPLGDSSKLRIGDWVIAVGSPFGLEQTVTAGIISAIRQSLNIEGNVFHNLLQTDAAINRGNSGGPLVNLRGEVIGINSAIYAPTGVFSGIGFAIPVNEAKKILNDLIKKGFVERSWMGVEIIDINEIIAQQYNLPSNDGVLVNQVVKNSPAEKAGLFRGDIVLEVNGKSVKNSIDLQDTISSMAPKTAVKLKILRNGGTKNILLITEAMPKQEKTEKSPEPKPEKGTVATSEWLGATVSDVSTQLKQKYEIEDKIQNGVILIEVPQDSIAADAGLAEGDLVRSINKIKIRDVSELKQFDEKSDLKKGVIFDVFRHGRWFYLTYKSLQ